MAPERAAMISNRARCSNGIKGAEAVTEPALATAPEINPPAPGIIPACSPAATALMNKV